jgi:hypothetical protein
MLSTRVILYYITKDTGLHYSFVCCWGLELALAFHVGSTVCPMALALEALSFIAALYHLLSYCKPKPVHCTLYR